MRKHKYIEVSEDYGPVKEFRTYRVMSEEYDHIRIKCHGSVICVPNNFIDDGSKKKRQKKRF